MPTIIIYACVALALIGSLIAGYAKIHGDGVKQGEAQVQAKWDAANRAAETQARAKEAADKKAKEKADAENAKTVADLRTSISRLRHERDARNASIVSAAPASSSRPDLACYDRQALESALRGLLVEVRGLADEGTEATVNLNTAKEWAKVQ